MEWFTIVLITFILLLCLRLSKKSRAQKMLDRLPGPPMLPLIGNRHKVVFLARQDFIKLNDELGRTYGPIFRSLFGPTPEVHIRKPEYMEVILASTTNIEKGSSYSLLHPWLGTGLLTSTGQKWFSHRKMLTPTFHFKILENFVEVFNENSQILVDKLRTMSKQKQPVDLFKVISRCALDIICETAMGTKVYAQNKEESEYVKAVTLASEITMKRNFIPWLFFDTPFYMLPIGREYKKQLNILHSFTNKVITERMKSKPTLEEVKDEANDVGSKKKKMFLDLLLEANTTEVNKLTQEEIREEVDTFMFEGHDTTTAGICWTLFLLGHHPEIQDEVYNEIKHIYGDDPDRSPTMKDLNEMKYLEKVIKESLRLYPSVPFIIRNLTQDVKFGEYEVPKDTQIILHIRDLHRDPEVFPNPEKFDPERFSPEQVKLRHPYAYVPFSAGSRNCIGQKFALLEEKTILSEIVRNFHLKSLEKEEDLEILVELVLRPMGKLRVLMTPR